MAVKNSLEIVTEQVCLRAALKVEAESGWRIVPSRWASVRKQSFTKIFWCLHKGDKGSCARCGS